MRAWLMLALVEILLINTSTRASGAEVGPDQDIRAGRQALLDGHPHKARTHFATALRIIRAHPGKNGNDKISALSGLGYADLWIGNDQEAKHAYCEGLHLAQSEADRKAMRLGLGRAFNGLGQSRQAYDELEEDSAASHQAELQSAVAANLLGWNTSATDLLREAAPNGSYTGPNWQKSLYSRTNDTVEFQTKPRVNIGVQYSGDSDDNTNRTYQAGFVIPGSGLGDNALSPTLWSAQYQLSQIGSTTGRVDISTLSGGIRCAAEPRFGLFVACRGGQFWCVDLRCRYWSTVLSRQR